MWRTKLIIGLLIFQLLLITDIDGNAHRRRRRRRRDTSGSLYGTNANLGASAPAGYNRPANTNFNGIRLNNPDARDLYGNPVVSTNTDTSLNSVNYYNQPRPQVQQIYGTDDQSSLNSLYSGNSYSYGGTNQLIRDSNGNLIPQGSNSASFYSSNAQMAYPPNSNQVLTNKDLYGTSSNTNNNQYTYNSNLLPNSNTYGGQMGSNTYSGQMGSSSNFLPNSNTYGGQMDTNRNSYSGNMGAGSNLIPNSNTYGGQMDTNRNSYNGNMGAGSNLVPNSNSYSGTMGTGSNSNSWLNKNNFNRYNQNSANALYPNRDTNSNNYGSGNAYSYPYNNCHRLTISWFIVYLSFFATIFLY